MLKPSFGGAAIFEVSISKRGAVERQKKKEVLQQKRQTLHLPRRFYHLMSGLGCFTLYAWFIDQRTAMLLLAFVGIPFIVMDFIRLRVPSLNTLALKLFGKIMRREELLRLSANSYYIMALTILVLCFPKPIALLGLLYLAAGDPIAAIVGSNWGRHPLLAGRTWEGSLANFGISALMTFLFALFFMHLTGPLALLLALVGGVISAVAEALPLPLNDNLTFPVIAACLLTMADRLLQVF